jgi:hypothetical protein
VQLHISDEEMPDGMTITISGPVTAEDAPDLDLALGRASEARPRQLTIDFAEVSTVEGEPARTNALNQILETIRLPAQRQGSVSDLGGSVQSTTVPEQRARVDHEFSDRD